MKERKLLVLKKRVIEIYGGECANKNDPRFNHGGDLTIHHIIFKRDGGKNKKENMVALCQNCHRFVHELAGEEYGKRKRGKEKRTAWFQRRWGK